VVPVDRELRRRLGVIAGLVAAAATLVVIAGIMVLDDDGGSGARPIATTPTPTPTDKHTATDPVLRNGQITDAQRYLGAHAMDYDWRSFDPVSETGLYVRNRGHDVQGLRVVGRSGPVAMLTCARDVPCSSEGSYRASLGPGPDEVTVASGDHTLQVIGFDGTVRRTLDLGATTTGNGGVGGLRWSPDGSRLAVVTFHRPRGHVAVSQLWLADRQGGNARLAYSLVVDRREPPTHTGPGFDGEGQIGTTSGWGWSPDGQTLLLDVSHGTLSSGIVSIDVVLLHLQPDGAKEPVVARTLFRSTRHFDIAGNVAWSPDGTRIAVRTRVPGTTSLQHRITEISAEDGRVIAQHPDTPGWLVWPARGR